MLVAGVLPMGPAEQAGLKRGDVITQVDGKAIANADALKAALAGKKPGDKAAVTYYRQGEGEKQATLTIGG